MVSAISYMRWAYGNTGNGMKWDWKRTEMKTTGAMFSSRTHTEWCALSLLLYQSTQQ